MPEISPYLAIVSVSIVVSQIIKFAIYSYNNDIDFKQLYKAGGIPSSFIAALAALVVATLAVDGLGSSQAGISIVLSGALAYLFVQASAKPQPVSASEDARVTSSADILLGAVVGLTTASIVSVSYWKDDLSWFFERPSDKELTIQFIGFGVVVVAGFVLSYLTRRPKLRKLPTSRALRRAFNYSLILPAVLGLVFSFAQQQTLGIFDNRIWTYLALGWILAGSVIAYYRVYNGASIKLKAERDHFSAEKKTKKKSNSKRKKINSRKKR